MTRTTDTDSQLLEHLMLELVEQYGLMACQETLNSLSNHKQEETKESCYSSSNGLATAIYQASFDGILVVSNTGTIESCNELALAMFGYTAEEAASKVIGKNVSVFVGGDHAMAHKRHFRNGGGGADAAAACLNALDRMRDVPARRQDGTEFFVTIGLSAVPGTGQYVAFLRDLTDEKKQLAKIEEEHRLNQAIVNSSFDSIILTDGYGTIQMVNQEAVREFGYDSASELEGQNVHILMKGKDAKAHSEHMRRFRESGKRHVVGMANREHEAKRKDGSVFPVKLSMTVAQPADVTTRQELRLVGFIQNATQEKKIRQLEMERVEQEKKAAEDLLMNMLPTEIADRLRSCPGYLADHFEHATILFADIVGFTQMSSTMNPMDVVKLLNDLFSRFDSLVDYYGLNKVKTIGDCYMITSVPKQTDTSKSCGALAHFGLDMIRALEDYNRENPDKPLNLRVGINSGPVVAGVVGTKRFLYDLWGDAVNTASRMESTGVPGKIQVTREVLNLVPPGEFEFERRGIVQVKGKGEMETFFLTGRRRRWTGPSIVPCQSRQEKPSQKRYP